MSHFRVPGDERTSSSIKQGRQSHAIVKCLATQESEEGLLRCHWEKRRDHFMEQQKKGTSHEWIFRLPPNPIRHIFMTREEHASKLLDALARFSARGNVPMQTSASDAMRDVLEESFQLGFAAASETPKPDPAQAWKNACPTMRRLSDS
jgi:hypothetical protein